VLRFEPDAYRLIRALMAYRVARTAKYMTGVSPYVAEHFRKVLRCRASVEVIPNALAPEWFRDEPRNAKCTTGITYASVLNGWEGRKNGRVLLEAFRLVYQALPRCRLLLFGSGYGPGEGAEGWARRQGFTNGVEFIGELDRRSLLTRLKEDADALVHPALEEACCMAIAEAMALCIPVIAGRDSGGVPHQLDFGRAGVLVDVRSPRALASEMLRLAEDRRYREEIARSGSELARRSFGLSRVMASYAELYRRLGAM